jgi:hypothetical protein
MGINIANDLAHAIIGGFDFDFPFGPSLYEWRLLTPNYLCLWAVGEIHKGSPNEIISACEENNLNLMLVVLIISYNARKGNPRHYQSFHCLLNLLEWCCIAAAAHNHPIKVLLLDTTQAYSEWLA